MKVFRNAFTLLLVFTALFVLAIVDSIIEAVQFITDFIMDKINELEQNNEN